MALKEGLKLKESARVSRTVVAFFGANSNRSAIPALILGTSLYIYGITDTPYPKTAYVTDIYCLTFQMMCYYILCILSTFSVIRIRGHSGACVCTLGTWVPPFGLRQKAKLTNYEKYGAPQS